MTHFRLALAVLLIAGPVPLLAQESLGEQAAGPPERIDLTIPAEEEPVYEDCSDEQEAASISGEIVVCRRKTENENRLYDREDAEWRHAEKTQGEQPADVAGPGIFRGPATVSGLCFIPPCPAPPAYMIDFSELPDAPPGSDADRIARGLPPLGRDVARGPQPVSEARMQNNAAALGLPPPLGQSEAEGVSPPESASPEEEP